MTAFAGQTLKSGHFLQPTAIATGQSVIRGSFSAFSADYTSLVEGGALAGLATLHAELPILPPVPARAYSHSPTQRSGRQCGLGHVLALPVCPKAPRWLPLQEPGQQPQANQHYEWGEVYPAGFRQHASHGR
jgi:hypothetical protein